MSYIHVTYTREVEEDVLTALEMWLWHTFGFEIRRMAPLAEPVYAFEAKRQQYSSSMILQELLEQCPEDAVKLLAVTERDLFIPMLSFVFGLAQLNGKVAVISLARLRQGFYGFAENRPLLLARTMKEAVHELGHTFGLVHCRDKSCAMSLSTSIRQVDAKTDRFCDECNLVLQENIKWIRQQSADHMLMENKK